MAVFPGWGDDPVHQSDTVAMAAHTLSEAIEIMKPDGGPLYFDKSTVEYKCQVQVTGEKQYLLLNKYYPEDATYFDDQDEVFLFSSNNTNGYIGTSEVNYLATFTTLKDRIRDHPVYFVSYNDVKIGNNIDTSKFPDRGANEDWYGWCWVHDADLANSHLFFSIVRQVGQGEDDRPWVYVIHGPMTPVIAPGALLPDPPFYFYNWREKVLYYYYRDENQAITKYKYETSQEQRIARYFGIVLNECLSYNKNYYGYYQQYKYSQAGTLLPGHYALLSPFGSFWCFTTTEDIYPASNVEEEIESQPKRLPLIYDTTYKDVQWREYDREQVGYKVETKGFDTAVFHPTNAAENIHIHDHTWLDIYGNPTEYATGKTTHFIRVYEGIQYHTNIYRGRICFYTEKYT